MNLTIQLPHVSDSETMYAHADQVLRFAMTRFTEVISEVRLRLVDENGPRGGVDQRCRVQVHLRRGGVVHVDGVHADPHVAIQQVTARAARCVARQLSRERPGRGLERNEVRR